MPDSLKEISLDISYLEMMDIFDKCFAVFMFLCALACWFWSVGLPKLRAWWQQGPQGGPGPAGGNQMDLLDLDLDPFKAVHQDIFS